MKRFQDYRPSRALIEAIRNVRSARQRLAQARVEETEKLARNAKQDARQQVARTGGNADPMGGQDKTDVKCGVGRK